MSQRFPFKLSKKNIFEVDMKITSTGQIGGADGPDVDVKFICESDDVEFGFKGKALEDGSI